jgi:hypothetical protein
MSALLGGYSYAAAAVQSSAKVVSHIVSTATPSKGSASAASNANLIAYNTRSSTAVYKPHLTANCNFTKKPGDENDSHDDGDDVWLVTVTGTSDDANPSDVIHAAFSPTGSGSTPGAASWTINATLHFHRPTSVKVTQTNSAGTGSVTVACVLGGGGGGSAPHLTVKCTYHKKKHHSNQWFVTASGTSDDSTHSHTISIIFSPTGSGAQPGSSHWSLSLLVHNQPNSVTVSQTNSSGTGTASAACTKAGKHHDDDDDDDDDHGKGKDKD